MDEEWVVLCQALFQSIKEEEWTEKHKEWKEVTRQVRKARQRVVGKVALRKTSKESSSQPKLKQALVFNQRSPLRESLMSIWRVDIHQSLRTCEDRHVEVNASDASCISLEKVDNWWPS